MKEKFQKLLTFLFIACFLTLGLKISIGNIAVISTFLLSVVYTFIYKPKIDWKNKNFWLFNGLFLIYLLSAFFSKDQLQGFHYLEKRLLFLLIPFPVMLVFSFGVSIEKLKNYFLYTLTFLSIVLIGNNVYKVFVTGDCRSCFFHDFTSLYKQHAVYYSLLVLIALIFLLNNWQKQNKIIRLISLFILSGTLLLASSKVMIVLYGILLLYFIITRTQKKWGKLALITSLFVIFLVTFQSNVIKSRFVEGLDFTQTNFSLEENRVFTYNEKENISDIELRYLLAKIGVKHIIQDDKWFFGYGLGDQQDWFDYHLMKYDLAPNWYKGFNVHNQYLDVWFKLGIFGAVYFLFIVISLMINAIKHKDTEWVFIILIFVIGFLFEAYLNRNKGIIFFTLFNSLYYIKNNTQIKA